MEPSSSKKQATPNTTDDEMLTTSTASDTFDSWTLVTDKQKDNKNIRNNKKNKTKNPNRAEDGDEPSDVEDRVENLASENDLETSTTTNEQEEQEDEPPPDYDAAVGTSATDEFSDEVSIISESDSGEILSHPNPYLREHLHTLNLKFTTGEGLDLPTLLQQQQLEEQRQQIYRKEAVTMTPVSNNLQALKKRKRRSPSTDQPVGLRASTPPKSTSVDMQRQCFVRRVYTLAFYCLIGLLLLGFFGKLRLPEWPSGAGSGRGSGATNSLEQKLIDMELQNNLMRAEIDILTKQVNYLNTLNEPSKANHKERFARGEKRAYKSNGYIAPEVNRPKSNLNAEDYQPTVTKVEEASKPKVPEAAENPEVPEKLQNFESNDLPDEIDLSFQTGTERDEAEAEEIDNQFKTRFESHDYKEKRNSKEQKYEKNSSKRENSKENKNNKRSNNNNNKRRGDYQQRGDDYDNDQERQFKGKNSKEKQQQQQQKQRKEKNSNERNDNSNESKERSFTKRKDKLKERCNRADNSNERFDRCNSKEYKTRKQQQRKPNTDEIHENGEWHEQMMKQREEARLKQQNRQEDEKNWYLNRRDSREQWRGDYIQRS